MDTYIVAHETNANTMVANHNETLRNRIAACRKGANVNKPKVNTGTATYHKLPILSALLDRGH